MASGREVVLTITLRKGELKCWGGGGYQPNHFAQKPNQ